MSTHDKAHRGAKSMSGTAVLDKTKREAVLDEMEALFMSATSEMDLDDLKRLDLKSDKILADSKKPKGKSSRIRSIAASLARAVRK